MSGTIRNLERGRSLAWANLRPAFDHAIALAKEAEYVAERQANEYAQNVPPAYPPLVEMLASAADPTREDQS